MFFSWSEREPSTSADLQTDCDSVAAYVLTAELGAKRAMALHFDVPRFPRKIDQLPPLWAADKTQQPPTLHYHRTDDARLHFYCSSEFYGVPLTHAMQDYFEDLLKKYMA